MAFPINFKRLFGGKEEKYDYEITMWELGDKKGALKEGDYLITLNYWVNKNYFMQAAYGVQKKLQKQFKTPEKFEIPTTLYGQLNKSTEKAIKQIEKQVQADKNEFKILSREIYKATVEKKGDRYYMVIDLGGICLGY